MNPNSMANQTIERMFFYDVRNRFNGETKDEILKIGMDYKLFLHPTVVADFKDSSFSFSSLIKSFTSNFRLLSATLF